jgi:NADH:ubiquinone oxidoreductase subunit 4 (subunit M)
MLQRVAFGKVKAEFENSHIHDMHTPEYLAWAPMLALIVALGVVPSLIFRVTDGPVKDTTVAHVEQRSTAANPEAAAEHP